MLEMSAMQLDKPPRQKSDIKGVALITLVSIFFLGAITGFAFGGIKLMNGEPSSPGRVVAAGCMAVFWGSVIFAFIKERSSRATGLR